MTTAETTAVDRCAECDAALRPRGVLISYETSTGQRRAFVECTACTHVTKTDEPLAVADGRAGRSDGGTELQRSFYVCRDCGAEASRSRQPRRCPVCAGSQIRESISEDSTDGPRQS